MCCNVAQVMWQVNAACLLQMLAHFHTSLNAGPSGVQIDGHNNRLI